MNFQAVLTATCLAAAVATVLMGLAANYPVALAPGMGENFFFAYTLCGAVPLGFGLTWQQALAAVLLAGVFFIAITLTGLRATIVNSIPNSLKCSIAAGIGLFITFIGLEYGGLVVAAPGTLVRMGDLRQPVVLATVAGLLLIVVLLGFRVRGAILLGILSSTAICAAPGSGPLPGTVLDAAPSGADILEIRFGGSVKSSAGAIGGGHLCAFLPGALRYGGNAGGRGAAGGFGA
jgi:adenine/guanine/hypoxanthine permease